jgi:hypothetical protein
MWGEASLTPFIAVSQLAVQATYAILPDESPKKRKVTSSLLTLLGGIKGGWEVTVTRDSSLPGEHEGVVIKRGTIAFPGEIMGKIVDCHEIACPCKVRDLVIKRGNIGLPDDVARKLGYRNQLDGIVIERRDIGLPDDVIGELRRRNGF